MGAVRLVEPELSASATATLSSDESVAFSGPGSSLWSEVWGWLTKTDATDSKPKAALAVEELVGCCVGSGSEVERVDAACELGRLARLGDGTALSALLTLFSSEEETARRAGFLGVSRAGNIAVSGLLTILKNVDDLPGGPDADGEPCLRTHIRVDVLYCLGQCAVANAAAMQTANPQAWLDMAGSVIDGAKAAIGKASKELEAFVAERAPVEGEALVFYVLERRVSTQALSPPQVDLQGCA